MISLITSFIFGVLTYLSFFFFPLGCFLSVFLILRSSDTKFIDSFLFAFGYFFAALNWLAFPLMISNLNYLIPIILLPIALIAIPLAMILRLTDKAWKIISLWVFYEYSLAHIGFSWIAAGYSFNFSDALLQPVDIIGIYGLSAVAIFIWLIPYIILRSKKQIQTMIFCSFFMVFFWIIGDYLLTLSAKKINQINQSFFAIQPNIAQEIKWKDGSEEEHFSKLLAMTIDAIKSKNHKKPIVIWPETAVTNEITEDQLDQLSRVDAIFIIGGIRVENGEMYNSAFVIDDGVITDYYDKIKLAPFGEYIPYGSEIMMILRACGFDDLANVIKQNSFAIGTKSRILSVGRNEKIPIILTICYEMAFPNAILSNDERNDAGNLPNTIIINLTNDAWFGKSIAPYQHLVHARVRAIEERKWILRCANTGISAIIDPCGRVVQMVELEEEGAIYFDTSIQ